MDALVAYASESDSDEEQTTSTPKQRSTQQTERETALAKRISATEDEFVDVKDEFELSSKPSELFSFSNNQKVSSKRSGEERGSVWASFSTAIGGSKRTHKSGKRKRKRKDISASDAKPKTRSKRRGSKKSAKAGKSDNVGAELRSTPLIPGLPVTDAFDAFSQLPAPKPKKRRLKTEVKKKKRKKVLMTESTENGSAQSSETSIGHSLLTSTESKPTGVKLRPWQSVSAASKNPMGSFTVPLSTMHSANDHFADTAEMLVTGNSTDSSLLNSAPLPTAIKARLTASSLMSTLPMPREMAESLTSDSGVAASGPRLMTASTMYSTRHSAAATAMYSAPLREASDLDLEAETTAMTESNAISAEVELAKLGKMSGEVIEVTRSTRGYEGWRPNHELDDIVKRDKKSVLVRAFNPTTGQIEASGKTTKLRRGKHQIDTLARDMQDDALKLAMTHKRAMKSKSETQMKYGW